MTVKEMIEKLSKIENQNLPVFYMDRSEAMYHSYEGSERVEPEIDVCRDGVEIIGF